MGSSHSTLKHQKGVITLQFLIVLILVLFFIISFFGLSMTLIHGSVVQYLTYSTARKLSLGAINVSEGQAYESARAHYSQLRGKLFRRGQFTQDTHWFQFPADLDVNRNLGFNDTYSDHSYRQMFYGVQVSFYSSRTNFKIPFLTDANQGELSTVIASYLGREPSTKECETFNREREQKICDLYPCGQVASPSQNQILGDNRC